MQEIQQDLNMDLDAFPTQKAENDADFDALLSDVRQLLEQDEPIPEPEEPIVEEAAPEDPVPDLEPAPADTDEDDRLEELLQRWIPEEPELPETADEASAQPQISMEQGPVVSADEVQIDYNRFYGETPPEPEPAAPIPEPEVPLQLPKLTFYEQSRPAYQSARRAEYERSREAQRQAREQERLAREEEEARRMLELENQQKKPKRGPQKFQTMPDPGTEAYAQWLYEQGEDPESIAQRERFPDLEAPNGKKKPVRKSHPIRTAVLILLVLLIGSTAALIFLARQPISPEPVGLRRENCSTILLAGVDEGGYRTDTMVLLTVDREAGQVSLVSIPRDTLVFCSYSVPKLNSAYGWAGGGEEGMEELFTRIGEIVGFKPDGYVLIGMDTLKALVDQMGGVKFDVPMEMHYEDPSQGLSIHLAAGEQRLNGDQALQLLRFRSGYPDADLGRVRVQQDFLRAALDQWLSPTRLLAVPGAMKLLRDGVDSDLRSANYLWLAENALLCDLGNIRTTTLPGISSYIAGGSYYVLDAAGVAETVNKLCNPYQNGIAVSDLSLRAG